MAGPIIKRTNNGTGPNAADMKAQCEEKWCPPDEQTTLEAYLGLAETAPSSAPPRQRLPSRPELLRKLLHVRGAEGPDGWHSSEVRSIARTMPTLVDELFQLLVETTRIADPTSADFIARLDVLFGWRVVGIPKTMSDENRGISVGNMFFRAWLSCVHDSGLQQPEDQWAGREHTTVTDAVADWLATAVECDAGCEQDLRAAYDLVPHSVAEVAMTRAGIPLAKRNLFLSVWKAARRCSVDGEMAGPIHPTRSLPQGESNAGDVLAMVLAPWRPSIPKWLFLDDRSVAARPPNAVQAVQRALNYTQAFDAAAGLQENISKHQLWTRQEPKLVEHLGLLVIPTDPSVLPKPRAGWQPLRDAIARLGEVPGAASIRIRCATAFLRPKWEWAAPLLEPVPNDIPTLLRRAILRSRCTWWCAARWWAQRAELHPHHSAAWRTFSTLRRPSLKLGPHVRCVVEAHARILGLTLVEIDKERGALLRVSPSDDARVLEATSDLRGESTDFWTLDAEHAIRIISRIRLLQAVRRSRNDSEGIDDVCVETQSHRTWTRFSRGLPPAQARLLGIFRSGAISTGTRRRTSRPCECGHEHPSARHLLQECPTFELKRQEIS